jgi:hypothetical protein
MIAQAALAIAALVWRAVQLFVAAQPLRKMARITQIQNLCFFIKSPSRSYNRRRSCDAAEYLHRLKIIKIDENPVFVVRFSLPDKLLLTPGQATDARGDLLAKAADDFAERSHRGFR